MAFPKECHITLETEDQPMSKFNRKSKNVSVSTLTNEIDETIIQPAQVEPTSSFTSAVELLSSLSDKEIRELANVGRQVIRNRKQSRKPAHIAVDTYVTWTVSRRKGEVVYQGVVVGCRGKRAYVKTATGIEVTDISQLKVAEVTE
jgi:hypothetical protein